MRPQLEELLALADECLALDSQDSEFEQTLMRYTDLLGEVLAEPSAEVQPLSADELKLIKEKHDAILSKAGKLRNQLASALRELQRRGKGILRYTDTLPKRISTIRVRKG